MCVVPPVVIYMNPTTSQDALFSLPRGYADGFTQWCKQVVALCLTTFMQTTLLFLGLMTWKNNVVKVNMTSVMHTTTTAVNLTKTLSKK